MLEEKCSINVSYNYVILQLDLRNYLVRSKPLGFQIRKWPINVKKTCARTHSWLRHGIISYLKNDHIFDSRDILTAFLKRWSKLMPAIVCLTLTQDPIPLSPWASSPPLVFPHLSKPSLTLLLIYTPWPHPNPESCDSTEQGINKGIKNIYCLLLNSTGLYLDRAFQVSLLTVSVSKVQLCNEDEP